MAASIGPCPHCGAQHEAQRLRCPEVGEPLPLRGRLLDGKFRMLRQLGSGGMATVWLARNEHVEREVALKLLSPDVVNYDEVNERFRIEARAAGRIGSPHICEVLDFAEGPLGPYIVMEYLRGGDFGQVLDAYTRLEPGIAVRIVRMALDGLAAAHAAGVIHRDLKPGNIFLQRTDDDTLTVKLMDFGVSKFQAAESKKHITGTGFLLGTPEYMAPEQLAGSRDIDPTADVFSMGAVLYRALSGERLFSGAEIGEVIRKAANHDFIPLEQLMPELAPGLVDVVARCIQRERVNRYPSAEALSDALAAFEADDETWAAWVESTRSLHDDTSKATREIDIPIAADPSARAPAGESIVSLTEQVTDLDELEQAPTSARRVTSEELSPLPSVATAAKVEPSVPVAAKSSLPSRPSSTGKTPTGKLTANKSTNKSLVPVRDESAAAVSSRAGAWPRLVLAAVLLLVGVMSVVWVSSAKKQALATESADAAPELVAATKPEPDLPPRPRVEPAPVADEAEAALEVAGIGGATRDDTTADTSTAGDDGLEFDDAVTGDDGDQVGGDGEPTDGAVALDDADAEPNAEATREVVAADGPGWHVIAPARSNVDYRKAHDTCNRLARISHGGRTDWHVPTLSEVTAAKDAGKSVKDGWYWTQNRAGSRRKIVRTSSGRTRSMSQSRRRALALCVAGP